MQASPAVLQLLHSGTWSSHLRKFSSSASCQKDEFVFCPGLSLTLIFLRWHLYEEGLCQHIRTVSINTHAGKVNTVTTYGASQSVTGSLRLSRPPALFSRQCPRVDSAVGAHDSDLRVWRLVCVVHEWQGAL